MSKIEQLIQELCPGGVKIVDLKESTSIIRGKRVTKGQLIENGKYPVISGGVSPMGYLNSFNRDENTITISQYGTAGYVDYQLCKFWANDICYCVYPKDNLNNRYLFYFLKNKQEYIYSIRNTDAVPYSLAIDKLYSIEIPLPPLPIQEEIVRILDTFTEAQTNLEQELELRKKQYEYYRNQLLTFDDSVKWETIGSFTRVFSASRVHKDEWQSSGVPFWRSSDVMSYHNGVENNRGKAYISYELYEKLSAKSGKIHKGDLLVTGGGSIGMPYIVPNDEPLYVKDADLLCIVKNETLDNRLLYKYMLSAAFRDYLKKITHDASIAHYTISQIIATPVPVPAKERQQEIVSILDKFESAIQTLEEELALRKKQYEYYREKLLTFN